jgi:hypothetical protein
MKRGVWMMIWLTTVAGTALANQETLWNVGELLLQNGTELSGELNFNWVAQVVQYRQGSQIKAFAAHQVQAFQYFDSRLNCRRKFVTIYSPVKSGFQRPRIVEEVFEGSIPVYREVYPSYGLIKVANLTGYSTDQELIKEMNNFTYLVSYDGELLPLMRFYRRIWPKIKTAFKQELTKYALASRADWSGTLGQLQMIQKYNYLTAERFPVSLSDQTGLSTSH